MDKEEITQLPPAMDLPHGIFGRYPKVPPKQQPGTGEIERDPIPTVELDRGPDNEETVI